MSALTLLYALAIPVAVRAFSRRKGAESPAKAAS